MHCPCGTGVSVFHCRCRFARIRHKLNALTSVNDSASQLLSKAQGCQMVLGAPASTMAALEAIAEELTRRQACLAFRWDLLHAFPRAGYYMLLSSP